MYKVYLLDGDDGDLLHNISIPFVPRHGENITIESSSIEQRGFATYKVDGVHYVHNPDIKESTVVIHVKNITS